MEAAHPSAALHKGDHRSLAGRYGTAARCGRGEVLVARGRVLGLAEVGLVGLGHLALPAKGGE